ncbi:uncharacterized protein LOC132601744 [Lycium barbarum]|uniref:uncharacterized protein LOC132601744 n=1 Tax=Lycium barbarum TaxID=112863 RepID=UPI00293EF2A3|nr:uncharacterized protein LOC132601744 [Lycium barbarum]
MPTSTGKFSVNSAWNILRQREYEEADFKHLWIKGVPFKISFFLLRLWKAVLPTDDTLRRIRIPVVSRCYCCTNSQQETMQHLFLTSKFAIDVWNFFKREVGIQMNLIQIHQVIRTWWKIKCAEKFRPILHVVPAMITWELWKRRNTIKHGGRVSFNRVIHEINRNLYYLTKSRYPWLKNIPFLWPELVVFLEGYKPILISKIVYWRLPYERWYKCNTDGASKGNPGPSSYGFCVRDWHEDLIYAECNELRLNSNVVAEARAMMEGLVYCVNHELHPLILETDSLLMKNVVDGIWEIPWCIITEVERIRRMKVEFNVLIQHVYREGM